ncbi:MAG: hypothetical protein NC311_14915 [Muribaculaceae bacterium]|nr:hypothetical protein [Muribaculaceae bacterium]
MTEIERLEKELETAKRMAALTSEIREAKCPLCGCPLNYSISTTSTDGGYAYSNHVRIRCGKCGCFGLFNSFNYGYESKTAAKESEVDDLQAVWLEVKQYVK